MGLLRAAENSLEITTERTRLPRRLFSKLAAPPRSIALECESRIIPSPDNGRIIVEIGEIPNRGEKRSYHSNPPPPPPPPRVNGHAMAILQTIGIRTIAEIALRLLVFELLVK